MGKFKGTYGKIMLMETRVWVLSLLFHSFFFANVFSQEIEKIDPKPGKQNHSELGQNFSVGKIEVHVSGKLALCNHDERGHIVLDVQGGVEPYSFRWNNNDTTQNRYDLYSGTYTVFIKDSRGTEHRERIVVQPPFPLIVEMEEITHAACANSKSGSAKINVKVGRGEPYRVEWSHGLLNRMEAENLPAGDYTVTVYDSFNCSTSISFSIGNMPGTLQAAIENTLDVDCANGEKKGVAWVRVSGGNPPYKFKWNNGEEGNEINFFKSTEVSVEVTDANGCMVAEEVKVTFPDFVANARLDFNYRKLEINTGSNVYANDPIQFESYIADEFISWEWDFGDGGNSGEKDPVHVFRQAGQFEVKLTAFDIFGCASEETNRVQVQSNGEVVVIPNAFTPNGDGLNDRFLPVMKGVSNFEMNIFNQWGEHIYAEAGLEIQGWDGFYRGNLLPQGNYVYKITYTSPDGKLVNKTGGVTLIR
ncbi:gliding motility-associated C-terminal domain-containing protein [Belliella marina]|uniref:Gliding motility-associated C-terminal domain-containing protein n=1 Tax=Belliella marina TaxID=1644146 RepID=A0ABW4VQ45_9BACT